VTEGGSCTKEDRRKIALCKTAFRKKETIAEGVIEFRTEEKND